jgi:hypothetical protein
MLDKGYSPFSSPNNQKIIAQQRRVPHQPQNRKRHWRCWACASSLNIKPVVRHAMQLACKLGTGLHRVLAAG